ncbi:CoA-binding domain protein [Thermogladius calderae 1633]|uniref:CoA-binding domain protein n=1 Tax=Thermogladius calderae (strain DSM 22663 / VKM B-2946 / 1633) TaxID=1184251 RepID=I3TEE8_THEC1|nr:CoA-binding domain protein [Thermogladius calderae 1633]
MSLRRLFNPESIAVIGASRHPEKIGHIILKNLVDYGFKGKLYPVNPEAGEILGLKAYKSVLEIEDEVDVAIITVPADKVLQVAEECGRKGVKFLVVITSGFSEAGNEEGERRLVEIARRYGMRVLGPNIFGYAYTPNRINATFGPKEIAPGGISFLTQSGALGIALMGWTLMEELGMAALVSLGNMSDLDIVEISKYLADDENTKVITIYLEGLKPGSGKVFIEEMKKVIMKKPVILIKAGKSARGSVAVASHTGSLAGSGKVYEAAFKQAGILEAETIEEMFDWARAFSLLDLPRGDRTIILTNGGGVGVLATDAAEFHSVHLVDPSSTLKEKLKKTMPWFGSARNPVDLTGGAVADNYVQALEILENSDEVDNIIVLYCRTAVLDPVDLAKRLIEARKTMTKPLIAGFVGGEDVAKAIKLMNKNGIPAYPSPERAVGSLAAMLKYKKFKERLASAS